VSKRRSLRRLRSSPCAPLFTVIHARPRAFTAKAHFVSQADAFHFSVNQITRRLYANDAAQHAVFDYAGRAIHWHKADAAGSALACFEYTRDPKGLPAKVVREDSRGLVVWPRRQRERIRRGA